MKTLSIILLTLAVAVPATWLATRPSAGGKIASAEAGRPVQYYQSAMHPWVKSDKPGRCTICGMELTPVYEGEPGFTVAGDMVTLSQSMVRVLNVQTAEATSRLLEKTLTFAGTIDDDARRHRYISAYVDGRIEKLYVNHHGAEVEAGKPLFEIYSPALLLAEREYLTVGADFRQSAAQKLRLMGLTQEQIAALPQKPRDITTSEILAPMTGTVVNDQIFAGQYVTAGQKLFEIADFSTMWFVFPVYEQDVGWLRVGQGVKVTTPALPGEVFPGRIAFIDPNFDPVTRTTQVRVELPNPLVEGRRRLYHRLYAEGTVALEAPQVLTVPRSAVVQTGPEAVVYVAHGAGAYGRHPVQLGRRGDRFVEILSGLDAGDKVVTNGTLLIDGQAEMNRSFAGNSEAPATPADAADHAP
jgi:Cu(I)/Ag(I) efflux system membrane fusion protein